MKTRVYTHAFSGGEVTPELFARTDIQHVTQSLATCRNFEVMPHGPVRNRTGTEFVKEVKNSAVKTRLIPFSFNAVQTFAIELGAGFFRFHTLGATLLASGAVAYNGATAYTQGALVTSAGVTYYAIAPTTGNAPPNATYWYALPADGTYELPNPYAAGDLFNIHYTQSADVMTLVHPTYPPMELRRLGASTWTLTVITFGSSALQPSAVVATASAAGPTSYTYAATSVVGANGTLSESLASGASNTVLNDLTVAGRFNTVTCTPDPAAVRVNYFKLSGGLYGYIGQGAPGGAFIDDNITPDTSHTPPFLDNTLGGGVGFYPSAVGYDEQRRFFAGWNQGPQNVLGTRSGTESDVNYHIPTLADDRIAFRVAAREGSQIEHIVPVQYLMLLTPTNVFRCTSADGGALTGSNINVRPQAYLGANNVQPVIVGTTVLYARAFGGHMTELAYNVTAQGAFYNVNDVTLLAPHLFDYFNIVDLAFERAPYPIAWAVNDQGTLLGMTYVPEQAVSGWHRHDTDGLFESCCVISEQGEDMLYLVVNRTIGGATKRYVERKRSRQMPTQADAFFVDCGATYSGALTSTITGLTWLEGKTVSILGDGAVMPQQVVTGGAVALQSPCSKVQVGLPITADLQTLPLTVALPDEGSGHTKNLNKAWMRVKDSSGIFAGPSFDQLTPYAQRTFEPYGVPPAWVQGVLEIVPDNAWTEDGQVCIRQTDPLPLTIISVTLEASVGG
jgi:hypothetical protein